MARQSASLDKIEYNRKITRELDELFLHRLQSGLLLALKEQGRLNELQYRHAQERLDRQHREWVQKQGRKGERTE